MMPDFHKPLIPGEKYHLLSRAVGNEKLFQHEKDYSIFLSRYIRYISPIADTYSYCLLPNHFHFLIKIKEETQLTSWLQQSNDNKQVQPEQLSALVMQQFSNLLNSYAKTYNKIYSRKGGFFIDFLRRVQIETDDQFGATIFYIHKNPVHHGCSKTMENWKWSSYKAFFSEKPTMLLREDVLNWFGGMKSFQDYHSQPIHLKKAASME
jgi:putative transposase